MATTGRERLYREAADLALRIAETRRDASDAEFLVVSSAPGEPDRDPDLERLRLLLVELDRSMPLERDVAGGVLEVLRADISLGGGHAWICVINAVGRKEDVTTFGCSPGFESYVEQWSRCREESVSEDTAWDRARRERRVVPQAGGFVLVDHGVVAACDILVGRGLTVLWSCEGHPGGAYLVFEGEGADVAVAGFVDAGWIDETSSRNSVVRMPTPRDVHDRDRLWRKVCDVLQRLPAPGNVAPGR